MNIDQGQIRAIAPLCRNPEIWVRPLNDALNRYSINNVPRAAAFFGQVAHESGQFNKLVESLIYTPQRLMAVWPKRFDTLEKALPYGRNPEKLGNFVYADRLGNGKEGSGDGFRYRGRGLLQITGRENYEKVARLLDLPSIIQLPDQLLNPKYAALSAAALWDNWGLNNWADVLTTKNLKKTVVGITNRINGDDGNDFDDGFNERIEFTKEALNVLEPDVWHPPMALPEPEIVDEFDFG